MTRPGQQLGFIQKNLNQGTDEAADPECIKIIHQLIPPLQGTGNVFEDDSMGNAGDGFTFIKTYFGEHGPGRDK